MNKETRDNLAARTAIERAWEKGHLVAIAVDNLSKARVMRDRVEQIALQQCLPYDVKARSYGYDVHMRYGCVRIVAMMKGQIDGQ